MSKIIKSALAPATTLLTILFLTVFFGSSMAACNTNGASDMMITSTALQSTVSYYDTLAPTMTAQAALAGRVNSAQATITALSANQTSLIATLNGKTSSNPQITLQPNVSVGQDTPNANPGAAAAASGTTPTQAGFGFDKVVMSKGIDAASGCGVNESTTFSASDPYIYVVGSVRNYKSGTTFTAQWTGPGSFSFQRSWTAPNNGTQICVNFYLQPKVLNLQAGAYSVTFSATGLDGTPIQFTVQ